jgi:PAS domain S-box-containing protein
MYNPLLRRQIRKYLGNEELVPPELLPLLEAVNQSYEHYESDRAMIERSIDISSQELLEVNERLRRESRESFRLLAENSSDVIARWDLRGSCLYISPSCSVHLGYNPQEMLGRTIFKLLHPDELQSVGEKIRRVVAEGGETTMLLRLRHREKGWIWFETTGRMLHDDRTGEAVEFQTSSRDVTERVVAYESLTSTTSRLAALLESLTGAVLVVDENRNIVLANRQYCRYFNISDAPESLAGTDASAQAEEMKRHFLAPQRFIRGIEETVAEHRPATDEEFELVDGRTLERDYIPIMVEGRYRGHLWHYRDITERKRVESRIRKLNDDLREANENLTEERDHEKENVRMLEELNQMKSDFVSSVSHELRTPLSSIIGFAQTLLIDRSIAEEMQVEFLNIVLDEGRRLSKLINDMLDLARIESGRAIVEKGEVDLVPILRRAVDSIGVQAQAKSIALNLTLASDAMVASFDADRIAQIVVNLISNAVKFTPNGGRVDVSAAICDRNVEIKVADSGMGIPADDIPKLFNKFYRVHRPGLEIRGTGLGLAIVKQLVALHDGTITVESELDAGSTFTVCFPKI